MNYQKSWLAFLAFVLFAPIPAFADSQGSATGGTMGTQSTLSGCKYTSTTTLTIGQQSGINCDSSGNLKVNVAAGSISIGTVAIDQTTPGSTNGVNIVPSSATGVGITDVVSTAAESCHVLKGSPGNLYRLTVSVTTASGYVLVFNSTTAPVDGAVTPVWWFPVSSDGTRGGMAASWGDVPKIFSTGITACYSSTGPFTKTASGTAAFVGGIK